MKTCLDDKALERMGAISAVKPEKAEQLQNVIIANMQRGGVQGKITEAQLIDLLNQFAEKDEEDNKVEFKRRAFDSDDDLDLDNLDL